MAAAIERHPGLAPGVNVAGGAVTNAPVAEATGQQLRPLMEALAA